PPTPPRLHTSPPQVTANPAVEILHSASFFTPGLPGSRQRSNRCSSAADKPPKATVRWGILARARTARSHGETEIQQFMMRLSRNLRRFRWLVFMGWLLALVPAIYLAMTQSGNLTGGGFEVAGSQSLYVHDQLDDQYHDQGASSLALVAAPRADASYQDINDAVVQLRQIAGEFPGVTEVPNPTQRP